MKLRPGSLTLFMAASPPYSLYNSRLYIHTYAYIHVRVLFLCIYVLISTEVYICVRAFVCEGKLVAIRAGDSAEPADKQ